MLRLTPPNGLRLQQTNTFDAVYGGSEANVAVSLAQMGRPARFVARVPANELGHSALGAVAQFGVDTRHCIFGGARIGIYFLEAGAGRRGSKILYDRQDSGAATMTPGMIDWPTILADTTWLHWSGITPALSRSAAATTLEALQMAHERGITISCDLNYRANLWQYGQTPAEVMPALAELTHVMMGDASSFALYFGVTADTDDARLQAMSKRFPGLRYISMTHRGGMSASHNTYKGLIFDGQQTFHSNTYDLPDMLDRIGGGDAFMAGLIHGLTKPVVDPQQTVEYATAAAALKHYTIGDFNLSTEAEVQALMGGSTGGWVKR
jgi:2-dehydro-3-deoxygluconokinase